MMPMERHEAAVEDLVRLNEEVEEAARIGQNHSNPHQSTSFCAYCDKRWPCEPRRLADLVASLATNSYRAGFEAGARNARALWETHGAEQDAPMLFPANRPAWLGDFQSWPCGRCGRDVDDSKKHRCAPVQTPEEPRP